MEKDQNILLLRLCKCGRAPHRKGQRNCHHCNREANAKYRRELKRMEGRWKVLEAAEGRQSAGPEQMPEKKVIRQ